jgi:anti-sigma regulatory factor (Ser/Thr protein kinase)
MEILTVPANIEHLEEVLSFAENAMQSAQADKKTQFTINTAIEEIFVNIASYAYPSNDLFTRPCDGEVTISISDDSGRLIIEFVDSGTPYDPLAKADPDITLSADEREIGGLGIFMMKKLMDDVRYRYEDGKNILTIYKDVTL